MGVYVLKWAILGHMGLNGVICHFYILSFFNNFKLMFTVLMVSVRRDLTGDAQPQ